MEIYYFIGTGNSLAAARDIALKTGAKLHSILSFMQNQVIPPADDAIGIVFPVYHGSLPLILTRFFEKMGNLQGKYIFGVCTFGDHPGLTIESLCKTMRRNGGKLAAGFSVHMQYNYITPPDGLKNYFGCFTLREIALEKQLNLFAGEKEKVETISEFVNAHKTGIFETDTIFVNRLVEILNLEEFLGKSLWLKIAGITEITTLSFLESRQLMDHAFQADENCKRCGICSRLCLVANITMLGGRPNWQHHCEQCFACLQWCPAQALQFGSQTFGRKRYHHPDVVLAELMKH